MSDSNVPLSTTRRGLVTGVARSLALAAAAPALASAGAALGQGPVGTPAPTPPATPVPAPDAPSSTAEALTEIARLRWGKHLSGEQLGEIAKALDGRLKGAEAMRMIALTNADEPDALFFAEIPGGR